MRTFDASFEPHIAHSLRGSGSHLFATTIASGGDADTAVNGRNFIDKGKLSWNAGLLTNPSNAGTFPTLVRFTSVDPDSGSANDLQGTLPTTVIKILYAFITNGATAAIFHERIIDFPTLFLYHS